MTKALTVHKGFRFVFSAATLTGLGVNCAAITGAGNKHKAGVHLLNVIVTKRFGHLEDFTFVSCFTCRAGLVIHLGSLAGEVGYKMLLELRFHEGMAKSRLGVEGETVYVSDTATIAGKVICLRRGAGLLGSLILHFYKLDIIVAECLAVLKGLKRFVAHGAVALVNGGHCTGGRRDQILRFRFLDNGMALRLAILKSERGADNLAL